MTLTQLEFFVLAAEDQSSTLAAKQLHITQSSVSHALKPLKKHGMPPADPRAESG
ncbi:LysR family transcriptional regulator [Acinetobacter sp.]|uniref:LysR family transcriptional regulator n=1 Tax=Acinetobacter sp. TaxID=472 RepID=UPI0035AFF221